METTVVEVPKSMPTKVLPRISEQSTTLGSTDEVVIILFIREKALLGVLITDLLHVCFPDLGAFCCFVYVYNTTTLCGADNLLTIHTNAGYDTNDYRTPNLPHTLTITPPEKLNNINNTSLCSRT